MAVKGEVVLEGRRNIACSQIFNEHTARIEPWGRAGGKDVQTSPSVLYLEILLLLILPHPFPTCINQKKDQKAQALSVNGKPGRSCRHSEDKASTHCPRFAVPGFLSVFLLSLCGAHWK